MYKIIIVDDHVIFRKSIGLLLERENIAKVVADAGNGQEFLDLLEHHTPDLVLMDVSMPVMDGVEATRKAIEKNPELKILTLSSFSEEMYYYKMVEAGVQGFLLKDAEVYELTQAVSTVAEGGSWFSGALLKKVFTKIVSTKKSECDLTDREIEIVQLICTGLTNEQIADKINLSYDTVRWHRSNILSKTQCTNTASLVMYAIKHKIVQA